MIVVCQAFLRELHSARYFHAMKIVVREKVLSCRGGWNGRVGCVHRPSWLVAAIYVSLCQIEREYVSAYYFIPGLSSMTQPSTSQSASPTLFLCGLRLSEDAAAIRSRMRWTSRDRTRLLSCLVSPRFGCGIFVAENTIHSFTPAPRISADVAIPLASICPNVKKPEV